MLRILLIERDLNWIQLFSHALAQNYDIHTLDPVTDIFEELKSLNYDCIILDINHNHLNSFDLLSWIKLTMPFTPVIVTSKEERAELIVKAIKLGAYDFIVKPFSPAKIEHVVAQALENRSLKNEIDYLRHEQDVLYDFDKVIAFSPIMKEIISTLKKFSKTDATILMTGETGTGKSYLSGTIHFNSDRRKKSFVTINCANIPETLLESELFGHEKGSFTGADKLRIGRIEQARGGTVFLDEIGEISPSIQSKLLRFLEEKSFERIGGNKTIQADVRVIVATNRNLEQFIQEGKFREDLYYRINILAVKLPPLRERHQDIEPLAYWLLAKSSHSLKKRIPAFSSDTIEYIRSYDWPGNIRQLANTIERAVILEETSVIEKKSLYIAESITDSRSSSVSTKPVDSSLQETERNVILKALEETSWVQRTAAEKLRISPRALNYKIKKMHISHPSWRKYK